MKLEPPQAPYLCALALIQPRQPQKRLGTRLLAIALLVSGNAHFRVTCCLFASGVTLIIFKWAKIGAPR